MHKTPMEHAYAYAWARTCARRSKPADPGECDAFIRKANIYFEEAYATSPAHALAVNAVADVLVERPGLINANDVMRHTFEDFTTATLNLDSRES